MRAVVTPTDTAGPGTGGVAYINSWKWGGSDIVCWVFNQGIKSCADTIAHEVGHTLGFTHNFAASTYGRGSVMDYPAPTVEIKNGKASVGTLGFLGGNWDAYKGVCASANMRRKT
jgi:hypothetical protein